MELDNMEIESTYLRAIQEIPGKRPGDKYKELNLIAQKIVDGTHGDSAAVTKVSEPLLPLVELEIANISKKHEDVVNALKSEDSVIINRVMTMRWFFRGENKKIINIVYFEKNIFPFVCLNTRIQLIKKLALNLRASGETKTAEEFYAHLATKYDRKQAEPLLVACGETFILNTVKESQLILSSKVVEELFHKFPNAVISYLKLSIPTKDPLSQNPCNIQLRNYRYFLPQLIKNHIKDFTDLLETHECTFDIKLSNKSTEAFLKNNIKFLLNKPRLYGKMMPLKFLAAKLTQAQYKTMFFNLLPERQEEFDYNSLEKYLKYFPEKERVMVLVDAYREAYKSNLLDNKEAINVNLLCILPANERARQARIKLETEPDWRKNRYETTKAWRCYLPVDESIPSIKAEISESGSDIDIRQRLAEQLFYTCKVNEDKDALLEALRYFTTRHKNEPSYAIFYVLEKLMSWFDLSTMSEAHWAILNKFIRLLHIKDELVKWAHVSRDLVAAGIHYNLINNLPIDHEIALFVEINFIGSSSWNILEKYPKYERLCLDAIITKIPQKYPENDQIWENKRLNVALNIVDAMYNFNTRNAKAKLKIDMLSLKSYSWLLALVKSSVKIMDKNDLWEVERLKTIIRNNEKDVYNDCVTIEEQNIVDVTTNEALVRLAKDPQYILDNCEYYVKKARNHIAYQPFSRRFIRQTRWHQEIPIKIVESCLKNVRTNEEGDASRSIVVLSLLMEGTELARIIEPLAPKNTEIDTEDDEAKSSYEIIQFIPISMNLANPPVPLSLVLTFCQNDYLNLGLATLTNTCRRVSVDKIETFTKTLVDSRVSVKKHGIRMFCLVASIQNLQHLLTELWKTETHSSIRAVIFMKIYKLFVNDPIPETWIIMKNCIADLKHGDKICLKKLTDLSQISNRFIVEYIKQLLETLEKPEPNGFSAEIAAEHVSLVLNAINDPIGYLLPEDFARRLLHKYFCNPSIHPDVSSAGNSYAINGYLHSAGDKLEQRLNTICSIYEDILKKYWDIPHPKMLMFFPINYLAHNFMVHIIDLGYRDKGTSMHTKIMEAILKSFLTVLKPQCDLVSYTLMTLGIALKDAKTPIEIITIIGDTLTPLVEEFGDIFVSYLPDIVKKWIGLLVDEEKIGAVMYDLIERLCQSDTNRASCLLAATFLHNIENSNFSETHMRIIAQLRKSIYPEVVSLIYLHVNNKSSTV